nr:STAS domain-containing protein [Planomonospora venezuelensis]
MELTVSVVHRDAATATAVISVTGEMDAFNHGHVEAELSLLAAEGALHVLVDCGMLEFCDVAALRMLGRAHRDLRGRGGGLVVVASSAMHRLSRLVWSGAPLGGCPAVFLSRREAAGGTPPASRGRHAPVLRHLLPGSRARSRRRRPLPPGSLRPEPLPPEPLPDRSAPGAAGAPGAGAGPGRSGCPAVILRGGGPAR